MMNKPEEIEVGIEPPIEGSRQTAQRDAKSAVFVGLLLVVIALVVGPTAAAKLLTADNRFAAAESERIPNKDVALVFGAGVYPDGSPTPYLRMRVQAAVSLLKSGKVRKIVMSGDNRTDHYNEPEAMKRYALSLGVSENDVVMDFAGLSTYDSCYRARNIFDVKSAIVVTQGYHLPRAVLTCSELGIDTVGMAATRENRDWTVAYIAREFISTGKAFVQLIVKPEPMVLGEKLPIDLSMQ